MTLSAAQKRVSRRWRLRHWSQPGDESRAEAPKIRCRRS